VKHEIPMGSLRVVKRTQHILCTIISMKCKAKQGKTRDIAVDYLRSISILVMMVLHINPYFPRLPFTSWFVNYGQWVVPAFILCSLAVGSTKDVVNLRTYLSYLWRRLKRLLIPYYMWLITYLALFVVLGHKHLTLQSILPNIFFIGGIDFNWLILLFIYITVALPFLEILVDKSERWSLVFITVCATVSIFFVWDRSYLWSNYRFYMLIPWWGVTTGLLLLLKWMRKRDYTKIITFSTIHLIIFFLTLFYFYIHKISLNSFNHKYPPDMYYFSYCLWTTPLAYLSVRGLTSLVSSKSFLSRFLQYVSMNSYTIFFVHLIVLYIFDVCFPQRPFNYFLFSTIIFIVTLLVVRSLEVFRNVRGMYRSEKATG
jgi:hypothetical protein